MDALCAMSFVDRVLVRGPAKTSVVSRRGTQVDVRIMAAHQMGAARLYFTGSKGHNIKLRMRALARGLTLNEYALSEIEGGKVVASETEEEIYAALGLPFIPPVLREDAGEIEAAEAGTLPRPLPEVTGDFHLHTTVSGDGRSSLEEMVAAARARGYRVLAVTDHAEGTLSGVSREVMLDQREKIRALARELGDELHPPARGRAEHRPRGRARLRPRVPARLRLVPGLRARQLPARPRRPDPADRHRHAGPHGAHDRPPLGAHDRRSPAHRLDLDAIFAAAEETGTALEVNGALPRLDISAEGLRRARGRDVTFLLTSDAHHANELGPGAKRQACRRAGLGRPRPGGQHRAAREAAELAGRYSTRWLKRFQRMPLLSLDQKMKRAAP